MTRKNNLAVSRLVAPYNNQGRSNLSSVKDKPGVYMIYKNRNLVYIGYSSNNLYRTITRHFQKWTGKYGHRVTYVNQLASNDFKIRICVTTPARAAKLESALILKHKPKDNTEKLKGLIPTPAMNAVYDEYTRAPAMTKEEWDSVVVPF